MIVIPVTVMEYFTKDMSEKERQEAWERFFNGLNK
jgi:hypothetical protein